MSCFISVQVVDGSCSMQLFSSVQMACLISGVERLKPLGRGSADAGGESLKHVADPAYARMLGSDTGIAPFIWINAIAMLMSKWVCGGVCVWLRNNLR